MLKFGKFQFLSLKISQNPVQDASFGPEISSESSIFVGKKKKSGGKSLQQALNPICSTQGNYATVGSAIVAIAIVGRGG